MKTHPLQDDYKEKAHHLEHRCMHVGKPIYSFDAQVYVHSPRLSPESLDVRSNRAIHHMMDK